VRNRFWLAAALGASLNLLHAGKITVVEDNDPSITYTGTWYTDYSSSYSGGSSHLTNAAGAQATIKFRGTGITWFGTVDRTGGIARVYLDGVLNTVDCSNGSSPSMPTLYQRPLFTARGLDSGLHSLSIEATHTSTNGLGSWVWVDGFNIDSGDAVRGEGTAGPGRVEQSNANVTYAGEWFLNTNSADSGGTAVLATDPGDRATITFTGSSITWIGYRDPYCGIAHVYIDGIHMATVDTYSPATQFQAAVFSIGNLAPQTTHTLAIEVTGTHNPAASESWIWVDAFDISDQKSNDKDHL